MEQIFSFHLPQSLPSEAKNNLAIVQLWLDITF